MGIGTVRFDGLTSDDTLSVCSPSLVLYGGFENMQTTDGYCA